MKNKRSGHTLPILIILVVSIAFGGVFELLCLGMERLTHPIKYDWLVSTWSVQYGVPEYVIYAMIKVESNFDSAKQGEHGKVGLLQLTPEQYLALAGAEQDPEINAAALYDPNTNIHYGTLYLSKLYRKYGMWSTVYAAWYAGEEAVDAWLKNPDYTDPDFGTLIKIPDKNIAKAAEKAVKAQDIYKKLYYAE